MRLEARAPISRKADRRPFMNHPRLSFRQTKSKACPSSSRQNKWPAGSHKKRVNSRYSRIIKSLFMKASSQYVILTDNYIAEGVSYPRDTPVPRHLVQPHHLKELEVQPGIPRDRSISGSAGSFVPGVSYPIGPDGQPIRTAETVAAEERAHKAQRELAEENWRASGLRYADPETGEIHEPEEQP